MDEWWIVIPRWDEFQHYKHRKGDRWHKEYAAQLDNPDWLELSFGARGLLISLRLLWGRGKRVLSASGARRVLSSGASDARRFDEHLVSLNRAGFIILFASEELAECYLSASPEEELLRSSSIEAASSSPQNGGRASGKKKKIPVAPPCRECGVGAGLHAVDCSVAVFGKGQP